MQANRVKKLAALLGSALILSATYVATSNAAAPSGGSAGSTGGGAAVPTNVTLDPTSQGYLQTIAQNTTAILKAVANLPDYINKMEQYITNMQAPDNSTNTAAMQTNFSLTGVGITTNANNQGGYLNQLDSLQLGSVTTSTLPSADDLLYSTIAGYPFFNPDPRQQAGSANNPDPAFNYIRNASGSTITHVVPGNTWSGTAAAQTTYGNYFAVANAVESFGAYVLANSLAEAKSGNGLTNAQMALVKQATDSTPNTGWFATIASEQIGVVLRQILMFESQNYVLMTQLLQTQKQQLAAQVMTNGILIAANQANEGSLLNAAQGVGPGH